jgi:hypothetical protein
MSNPFYSPINPEKTTKPNPPITAIDTDIKTGPMLNIKPKPPTVNRTSENVQIKAQKILFSMIKTPN